MSANYSESSKFENDFQYQVDKQRGVADGRPVRSRRPQYSRSSSRPGAFNGIHRRRNKRWSW